MSTRRRGLTLLETLLAAAILAMLAAVCVPMLSTSLRAISASSPKLTTETQALRFDLSRFANAFMGDPGTFGIKDVVGDTERSQLTVSWPKDFRDVNWPAVLIRRSSSPIGPDHRWLIFECEGSTVVRYLALPKPKEYG